METQGVTGRAGLGRRGGERLPRHRIVRCRLSSIVALAILPIAAGCSASPPWSSSANPAANQAAAVPPPPNYQATAATPPPGQQGYAPPAQAPPPEPGTVGSLRQSYVGFLQMFRDPREQDPSAQNTRSSTTTQQPYVPPQGQPASSPAAQQNYAPPAQQNYAPRSGQQSYAAPPAQPAYAAPAATAAASPPPAQQDSSDVLPYPKQSLIDLFRSSTQTPSQTQTVPRPPGTYTASGQPYSPPPGQPANGTPPPVATAAAAPPANPDPTDVSPYPKQTLFEVFSGKQ